MSEASEYVADLVEFGKHDYADLSSVELEEISLIIYKEVSDEARQTLIMDSQEVTDLFSLLLPVLDGFNPDAVDKFKEQAKRCLIEMNEGIVREMIAFEVDSLEENNRLRQQDSEYVDFKESQL